MVWPVLPSTAAPIDVGVFRYSRPPTMSGVALKLVMDGGSPSRHRFGSALLSCSKVRPAFAQTSPRPGIVRLRKRSADCQRQTTLSVPKLVASIWVSGEYFVAPRSPAYDLHSPRVAPCCAQSGSMASAIAADDDTTAHQRSQRHFMISPLFVLAIRTSGYRSRRRHWANYFALVLAAWAASRSFARAPARMPVIAMFPSWQAYS